MEKAWWATERGIWRRCCLGIWLVHRSWRPKRSWPTSQGDEPICYHWLWWSQPLDKGEEWEGEEKEAGRVIILFGRGRGTGGGDGLFCRSRITLAGVNVVASVGNFGGGWVVRVYAPLGNIAVTIVCTGTARGTRNGPDGLNLFTEDSLLHPTEWKL